MKGRPPKPAALRTLHGSRTRPNHQAEPTIPDVPVDAEARQTTRTPVAPRGLIKAERAYWNQFAPLLAGAKILTPADVETLADYCRACVAVDDRGRRLRRELGRRKLDNQSVRMLDSQLRGWIERKTNLAGYLGLTAISRTRVHWSGHNQVIDKKVQPQSKLAQLQEQAASLRRPVGVK